MGKWMKLGMAAALASAALLYGGCGGGGQGGKQQLPPTDKPIIAVVQIVQHGSLDQANQGFVEGLKKRGYDENKVYFDQQNAQGDQSNLKTIVSRFKAEKPKLICAIATPAAQAAANEIKDIPIVGTAITDYTTAKLVKNDEHPGGNVTGVSDLASIDAQMDLGRALVPNAKKIGLIYCSSEVNSEVQANMMKEYCKKNKLSVEERTVNNVNDIQQVAESLVGKVDFIYVPTDNTLASAIPTLMKITDANKIPVIVGADIMAKDGALAALSVDYYKLGLQTGQMAADILDGKIKPETAPIQHQKEYTIVINKKDAEILGIQIPDEIAKKAQMV
ncbi:ABC transporter substrate-binding protein [Dialister sp.]|uniref:ABC transporter substrate-binding protein n=1 Tax=Dialister sp. TaxID=1955814 RepID=UPI002E822DE0|nr:ABC transporter substrate-binding protein [Dialister sp.]MEE3452724.1 ABC transporter substrate-binding protein [Dialister sp.]